MILEKIFDRIIEGASYPLELKNIERCLPVLIFLNLLESDSHYLGQFLLRKSRKVTPLLDFQTKFKRG